MAVKNQLDGVGEGLIQTADEALDRGGFDVQHLAREVDGDADLRLEGVAGGFGAAHVRLGGRSGPGKKWADDSIGP